MARQPISMRQIKEILRLKHELKLSVRDIARSCAVAASTVGDYLKRAEVAGIGWPLPEAWTEDELLERLLGPGEPPPVVAAAAVPDWAGVHEELRRKGVTLRLLWQEYREVHPEGYGYSRFCELYERWAGALDPVLRQVHPPGEKMFVDWAGQSVSIYSSLDGTVTPAFIFVAVLGASNKTYAEAFPNQKLSSWITAHCRAYGFFEGVAKVTVPDNPKTAVSDTATDHGRSPMRITTCAMSSWSVVRPGRSSVNPGSPCSWTPAAGRSWRSICPLKSRVRGPV